MSEKDLNVDRACCPLISGRATVMAALGAGVVTALGRPGWCKHDRQMAVRWGSRVGCGKEVTQLPLSCKLLVRAYLTWHAAKGFSNSLTGPSLGS